MPTPFAPTLLAADAPTVEIRNDQVRARIYLPDATRGFYRGSRFDWSGVIYSLKYKAHEFYGPWFDATDPSVHDFVYRGDSIVAGPCSAITGPVDSFDPLGWEQAAPGGTFVKIGIGGLRKPADAKPDQTYDAFRLYEIADGGKWTVRKKKSSIEFEQVLADRSSGFGYDYRKIVRLTSGKAEMVLEHRLRNTGTKDIRINVYNHNFLVLDRRAPGPGMSINFPFPVHATASALADVQGSRITYKTELQGKDVFYSSLSGFGSEAGDNMFRVEDSRSGAAVRVQGDRPLNKLALWSIRTTVSLEPFIALAIEPGQEYAWTSTYSYAAALP